MPRPIRAPTTCTTCGRFQPECGFTPKTHRCRDCSSEITRRRYNRITGREHLGSERIRGPKRAPGVAHREAMWRYIGAVRFTEADYQRMLTEQDGRCLICSQPPTTQRRLHVDHDHATGQVRGLLCHYCNLLLGHAKDDPAILAAAIEYLSANR